jgi:hypothetical protein
VVWCGLNWLRIGASCILFLHESSWFTKVRNFLNSWVSIGLSRHGVSWFSEDLEIKQCTMSSGFEYRDLKHDILKVSEFQHQYEGVPKSFRTGYLERELQMLQFSATRCICIAILWVSLVSFAAMTLWVASQQVFIVVSVYFVIDSVRKLLDTPSYNWFKLLGFHNLLVTSSILIHNTALCTDIWSITDDISCYYGTGRFAFAKDPITWSYFEPVKFNVYFQSLFP